MNFAFLSLLFQNEVVKNRIHSKVELTELTCCVGQAFLVSFKSSIQRLFSVKALLEKYFRKFIRPKWFVFQIQGRFWWHLRTKLSIKTRLLIKVQELSWCSRNKISHIIYWKQYKFWLSLSWPSVTLRILVGTTQNSMNRLIWKIALTSQFITGKIIHKIIWSLV